MDDPRSLGGIIGAVLTPWTPEGAVDADALQRQIDFLVGHCDAISVLGAEASEYQLLDAAQRRHWLREGIAMAQGRVPVLAGASAIAVREVVELAELAAEAGADLVQVLMPKRPWGGDPSTAEVVAYFTEVAARSPLPVVAYHNPARGSDPALETFVAIAQIEGVAAFKESSRDIGKIDRLIAEIDRAGHARYFTTMQPLLQTMLLGGAGAMMPAPATVIGAEVVAALRAGDSALAVRRQEVFSTFPSRWRAYGLAPVMKSALRYLGVDAGGVLAPFADLTPDDERALHELLERSDVRVPDPRVGLASTSATG